MCSSDSEQAGWRQRNSVSDKAKEKSKKSAGGERGHVAYVIFKCVDVGRWMSLYYWGEKQGPIGEVILRDFQFQRWVNRNWYHICHLVKEPRIISIRFWENRNFREIRFSHKFFWCKLIYDNDRYGRIKMNFINSYKFFWCKLIYDNDRWSSGYRHGR